VLLPDRRDALADLARQTELALGFKQLVSVRRPAAGVAPWQDHAAAPHIGAHDSPGGSFQPGLMGMMAAGVMAAGPPLGSGALGGPGGWAAPGGLDGPGGWGSPGGWGGPGGPFGFGEGYGAYGDYWAFRALGAGMNPREQRPMTPRPDVTRGRLTPATEDMSALTTSGEDPTVLAFALGRRPGRVV
jgi:hypothetical protein